MYYSKTSYVHRQFNFYKKPKFVKLNCCKIAYLTLKTSGKFSIFMKSSCHLINNNFPIQKRGKNRKKGNVQGYFSPSRRTWAKGALVVGLFPLPMSF